MNSIQSIGFSTLLFLLINTLHAQKINRIDPPYWFASEETEHVQLLLIGEELTNFSFKIKEGKGKVEEFKPLENNPSYAIVTLAFEGLTPFQDLVFEVKGTSTSTFEYQLKPKNSKQPKGLDPTDFIYLITPDRFANGDATNDSIADFHQNTINRNDGYERHGGDLQGIKQHLGYIEELGATAIWINPVYENNQDHESYHGYAITDFYAVDPRFGGNEAYADLIRTMRGKDLKIVKDVVYNHIGNKHYLAINPPDSSWFHYWPEEDWNNEKGYTRTSYRATTLFDPYTSDKDYQQFSNGWFDCHMPDINQHNEDVQDYLIQQTIWWVETYNIDALRVDTYAYPDQAFMKKWARALLDRFPTLFIFSETWVHGITTQQFFVEDLIDSIGYADNLSVTDFQLYYAFNNLMNEDFGWTNGAASVYYTLAKDIAYTNPTDLVTFLDNHDLARFYGVVGENFEKFKTGINL